MSLRPLILVLSALMLVETAAAGIPPRQLAAKQKEILLELGREGIPEAWYQLARLESRNARGPGARRRVLSFYERAARLGNLTALRLLGIDRLHEAKNERQRQEALVWIAQAALLGNPQAQNDLLLLPRMTPLDYREIEQAAKEAARRIRRQESPLHCVSLGMCLISPDDTLSGAWGPHQQEQLERFYHGMEMSGTKTLDAYLGHLAQTAPISSLSDSETVTGLQSNPQRLRRQQQAGRELLSHNIQEDYQTMRDSLERIIKHINRHLAPKARITFEEVMQLLGERP